MPNGQENREERDRERNLIINENPEMFSYLKEREMTQNMAKLLMVSREKKTHLGDVLHPNKEVQERLDKIADELALVQLGTMDSDEKIQEKYEKEWENRTKECRDFVINMDYERESIYALGISPKNMKRSKRNAVMNDPQNMGALKKITDDMSDCIKKADEFHDLSSIMVNEKSEPVPQVKERIETLDNVSVGISMFQNSAGKEDKQEQKSNSGTEITSKDLEYLKTDETYTNMAKLLVMSRDNLHFGDVQNPSPEIQERLDKTVDSLVAIQARTLSADEKVREAGEKAWEKCTEKCRSVVMDMNYSDECLHALGMDPEKTDPARQKMVMNDPQNMGALRKITDGMADCIEKADKYGILSNIRVNGKDEPIPNIKKQIESLREFSSVYKEVESQEKKERSSGLNRKESRQEEKRERPRENKVRSAAEQGQRRVQRASQAPSRADSRANRLNAAREQMAKLGGRPRPVQAPPITDAQDLPTKMSILQWIARLLGLGNLFDQAQKNGPSANGPSANGPSANEPSANGPSVGAQNRANQRRMFQPENRQREQMSRQRTAPERNVQQNRPMAKAGQEKNVQQKASGQNVQKKSDFNARYLAAIQDARREILRLRIENMRKTNMIKFLRNQLTMAQLQNAGLGKEKSVSNEKTAKKEKAGVEKVSFKQLLREESGPQRRRQRMERSSMERSSMERKSMDRNPLQMSEKTKKSRERSFGK